MKIIAIVFCTFITLSLFAQPRIWNADNLIQIKATPSEASKKVIRDADKMLVKTITTVMDKEMTPASGDKHDYMSAGRYWWPDPKKADGLPYIRKDGVVNPEIDKLDRYPLSDMARNVYYLSLAYYFTGNEKYAAKAVENLRIWFIDKETKMNPNMDYAQMIPGLNNGKGRGEGVLDSYSFVEMLDGVELLKKSKSYTSKDSESINQWFSTYLNWMLTSDSGNDENRAKNNHGTAFDIQATRYALFVKKEEIAKKIINDFPSRRIFTQIEPNGAQPLELARTTAFGYSVFNLTHMLDMCCMAKSLGIDLFNAHTDDGRSITKAIEFLLPYVGKPKSDFPYEQIKDWDKVQKEVKWQLYRADSFLTIPLYKNYYTDLLSNSENDNNKLFY